jgi:hypothetical protein
MLSAIRGDTSVENRSMHGNASAQFLFVSAVCCFMRPLGVAAERLREPLELCARKFDSMPCDGAHAADVDDREHVSAVLHVDSDQRVHVRLQCTPAGWAMQTHRPADSVASVDKDHRPGPGRAEKGNSVSVNSPSFSTQQDSGEQRHPRESGMLAGSHTSSMLLATADKSVTRRSSGSTRSVAGSCRPGFCFAPGDSDIGDGYSTGTSTVGESGP